MTSTSIDALYQVNWSDFLVVRYQNEDLRPSIWQPWEYIRSNPEGIWKQVSALKMVEPGPVWVNESGYVVPPLPFKVFGAMAEKRVADLLPRDFPVEWKQVEREQDCVSQPEE